VLTLIAAVSLSKATILSSVTLSGRQDMNIVFASSPPFAPARAEITIRPHPDKNLRKPFQFNRAFIKLICILVLRQYILSKVKW
jgi:hypothetical protein